MTRKTYDLKGINRDVLDRWLSKYRISPKFETGFDGTTGAVFFTGDFSKCFSFDFVSMKLEVDRK